MVLIDPPPRDLHRRNIKLVSFDERVFRTHPIELGPIYFGRRRLHRFDAPDGPYGVLYAGRDLYCAFIETFGSATGTRTITTTALKERSLAELMPARALRLIDLTSSGALVRALLFSGPHDGSRLWSEALHNHPCHADGLLYPSRLDPLRHSIALFEDRAPKLVELNRQSWYAPGKLRVDLANIIDHYDFQLIETQFVAQRKPMSRAVQTPMFPETE